MDNENQFQNEQPPINEKKKFHLSSQAKTFILSISILLLLMIAAYIMAMVIPSGEFIRDPTTGEIKPGTYQPVTKDFPFWKFLLSPVLIFGADGGTTTILILVFLFIVSGVMTVMNESNILSYLFDHIVYKFGKHRYLLLFVIILFFMLLGSFVGSFEEIVPFVPLVIVLMTKIGYTKYTGIGISLVAVGCGFSCGIMNPFTVGVAQKIIGHGLTLVSGIWLRIVTFIIIYLVLCLYVYLHAKKTAKEIAFEKEEESFQINPQLDHSALAFGICLGVGIALVIMSSFITALQSISLIFVALGFLLGGLISAKIAGITWATIGKNFLTGIITMLPAMLMILMASSVKYILSESKTLDTILNSLINLTNGKPQQLIIIMMYLIVLLFNLFIPSGSAKAFLLIPLLAPLAQTNQISYNLVILAFAFGDGFSNLVYPTNPVLLLSLNVGKISYGEYLKKYALFFAIILVLTTSILLFGQAVSY